jgi:hypothetical protein
MTREETIDPFARRVDALNRHNVVGVVQGLPAPLAAALSRQLS